MMKFVLSTLLLNILKISAEETPEVIPSSISVVEDEGFSFYLQTTSTFGRLTSCSVENGGQNYTLATLNGKPVTVHTANGELLQKIMGDECGATVMFANVKSETKWTLATTDEKGNTEQGHVIVNVIKGSTNKAQKMSATLGTPAVMLKCGPPYPLYCFIYDPKGTLVADKCEYLINDVDLEDFGTYKCRAGVWGSLQEVVYTTTLEQAGTENVVAAMTDTDSHVTLACSLRNSDSKLASCRAVLPDGDSSVSFADGLASARYSALGTSLSKQVCNLTIPKPLTSNETGLWKLHMLFVSNANGFQHTGCLLQVGEGPSVTDKRVVNDSVKLLVGSELVLQCSVPYPVKYCYLLSPNGTRIMVTGDAEVRLARLGECRHVVTAVTMADHGKWACGLSSKTSGDDVISYTTVDVVSQPMIAESGIVYSDGTSATLLCLSTFKKPLQYCRFQKPSGEGLSLTEEVPTAGGNKYMYYGNGLQNGDCGVHVVNPTEEDFGTWTCFAKLNNQHWNEEISAVCTVLKKNTTAASASIGVGVGIIFVALMGVVVFLYNRHRTNNNNARRRAHEPEEEDAQDSI